MRESFVLQLHVSVLEEGLARKLPLSQLPLSVLEGGLAQKLRLHIFNFDFSREVLHESFLFHIFLEEALPSHLSGGGLARKLVCCHFFKEVSVFTTSTFSLGGWPCAKASLYIFRPQFFEGVFARKLPFHNFKFQVWRDVWHESSVFTSSAYSFGRSVPRKLFARRICGKLAISFPGCSPFYLWTEIRTCRCAGFFSGLLQQDFSSVACRCNYYDVAFCEQGYETRLKR